MPSWNICDNLSKTIFDNQCKLNLFKWTMDLHNKYIFDIKPILEHFGWKKCMGSIVVTHMNGTIPRDICTSISQESMWPSKILAENEVNLSAGTIHNPGYKCPNHMIGKQLPCQQIGDTQMDLSLWNNLSLEIEMHWKLNMHQQVAWNLPFHQINITWLQY